MVKVLQSQEERFTAGFESKFFGLSYYVELKNARNDIYSLMGLTLK